MKPVEQDPDEIAQHKQEVAGIYSRAAATFDHVGPRYFSYFGRRLVALARLAPGEQVLDVACGRGAALFPAVEAVSVQDGPQGQVTGIDLSPGMVAETRLESERLGLRNVTLRQMDAENLEFPDKVFEAVLCGFALFFFPQLAKALAEFKRVLAPGGRLAVSTWGQVDPRWQWQRELFQAYLPVRQENPNNFSDPLTMQSLLQTAGFKGVQVHIEAMDFVYPNPEAWWDHCWTHGIRRELEEIEAQGGAPALERFKNEAFEKLQGMREADGIHAIYQALFTLAVKA